MLSHNIEQTVVRTNEHLVISPDHHWRALSHPNPRVHHTQEDRVPVKFMHACSQ